MVRIRKDILDAIVKKTSYSKRHIRNLIDKLIAESGYTIPDKRIGANILASKLHIRINEILDPDELAEVRRYRSDPVIESIQIQMKGIESERRRIIKIDTHASKEERIGQLVEENTRLLRTIERLKTDIEKLNPRKCLEKITIPQQMERYIEKAMRRVDEGSFSDAIMNCYRVSETLADILFNFLYHDAKKKRIKHEDKLKKIWNDEEKEKKEYPGIRVIASLLAVILWYRNKMGAHTEMTPTKQGARICIVSLIQAIVEFDRLGIKINTK